MFLFACFQWDTSCHSYSSLYNTVFFWLLLHFSLLLVLSNSIAMWLCVVFSLFLVLGVHWYSWICEFIIFIKFWKFSVIISSNIFHCPFLPLGPPIIHILYSVFQVFTKTHWYSIFKNSLASLSFKSSLLFCTNLLLIPANAFLIYYNFHFRKLDLYLFISSMSLTFWTYRK